MLSDSDYKELFINSRSWLEKIDEREFKSLYYRASDYMLSQNTKLEKRENQCTFKLDRNFHVYVHGDRSRLEEGEGQKGKFMKLYYENSL